MFLRKLTLAAALTLTTATSSFACEFTTDAKVSILAAGFEAWKAVAASMAECDPNLVAELDQEFRTKQPTAFAANPSLYHLGGVSNGTLTPLLADGSIRPLDDLVEKYGQNLSQNQLIRVDGKIMAIGMDVNLHHLQYRKDIFDDLGLAVPTTMDEMLAAAETIKQAGAVEYPIGATMMTGWNQAMEFINYYTGNGGELFDGSMAAVNNSEGVKTLELMKAMQGYMDPEWAVADSTFVQQQFQNGKIAMSNFWQSRAAANDDPTESQVVGKIETAAAPLGVEGGRPVTVIWWDGIVVAKNITDEEAETAFRLALEGMSAATVERAPGAVLWLIPGFEPGRLSKGAIDTLQIGNSPSYPSTAEMGLLHTAIGNTISDYFTGAKSAEQTLADTEAAYVTSAKEAGLLQ